jgi:hypothetical protein
MAWRWNDLWHRKWRNDLSAYADGDLETARLRELEAHLATCESCQQELAELQATKGLLQQLPQVRAPRSFAISPAQTRRPVTTSAPWFTALRGATVAAVAAFAILLAVDFVSIDLSSKQETAPPGALDSRERATEAAPAAQPGIASEEAQRAPMASPAADLFGSPQATPGTEFGLHVDAGSKSSDGRRALRIAEITLGGITSALAVGWIIAARRRRRVA